MKGPVDAAGSQGCLGQMALNVHMQIWSCIFTLVHTYRVISESLGPAGEGIMQNLALVEVYKNTDPDLLILGFTLREIWK